MLKQNLENRHETELYLRDEKRHIDMLNKALGDIKLTPEERKSLLWLCGWETSTIENIISAFIRKEGKEINYNINIDDKIIETVSKKLVSLEEYKELQKWYRENHRFSWLGSVGVDGTGDIYQLVTDYGLTNEKVYEFYLYNEYYKEMNS